MGSRYLVILYRILNQRLSRLSLTIPFFLSYITLHSIRNIREAVSKERSLLVSSISTVDLPALHNKGYLGSPNISHLVVGPGKLSFVLPFSFLLLESEFGNVCRLDVNYGGSSGYGRKFIERLRDNWGIVDVQDSITAPQTLGSPTKPALRTHRQETTFHSRWFGSSLLRYRLQATWKCSRERHHSMAFRISNCCTTLRTSLSLSIWRGSLVELPFKSLQFIKRGHLFITPTILLLLYW